MNLSETADLLTAMSAFDRRTIGEGDVIAWQSILSDAAFEDCLQVVKDHYAEQTDWVMPAHVRRGVRDIERVRQMSPWAPGQYGVPREEAAPEVTTGDRLALSDLPAAVADLVARVRADLPEGSREALKPRTVAWEREHAAFQRSQVGEPNPHYKPRPAGSYYDPAPDQDDPAMADWLKARGWGSYEDWVRRGQGEREPVPTGILPDAHRCADCTFVTANEERMDGHLHATGHVHE